MSVPYEQAVSELLEEIPKRVSEEMRLVNDVVTILATKYLNVFLPANWDGISGVPELDLATSDNIPSFQKPRSRPINPKLFDNVKKEFERLLGYFYEPSTSPYASCLVIAMKKTPPYVRLCGDYRVINKYLASRHFPIPNVWNEVLRIADYNYFVDLDMKSSFYQIRLSPRSRRLLSIQTPFGQVEPKYTQCGAWVL
jgi:hypothetical protein